MALVLVEAQLATRFQLQPTPIHRRQLSALLALLEEFGG
jgi:hypothetical protein